MMLYLLKSMTILAILIAFYILFLEREKMHRFNRFYLISGLGLSFLIPLITIYTPGKATYTSLPSSVVNTIHQSNYIQLAESIETTDWIYILELGFYMVCGILLFRFIFNLIQLILKIINHPNINYKEVKIVFLDNKVLPHTFLQYVFLNEEDFSNNNIEDELLTHEITHAKQWHSLDIILVELVTIFHWFNPFAHVYKKAIQLNHEFLADQEVVKVHENVIKYQHLLLEKSSEFSGHKLSSKLTFSVTKKRLTMMTKHFSRFRSVIYSLVLIPILISLVSCFGEYDYKRRSGIVNIVDNYLSVDFNGMNQNQLSEAQTNLMDYDIDLQFTTAEFDETGKLTEVAFDAWFPNGNNINASLNCSSFKFPFGLWYDLDCGACGSGILDDAKMYHFKKTTLERASQVNDANGQFYINGGKANYDLTINWVHSARKSFQSTFNCDTIVGSKTLSLESF